MKRIAFIAAMAACGAFAAEEPNDWENPAVNSINRLPARTYAMPLADEASALTDALEPATPYAMSLNGDWKFNWVGDSARRPLDFWKTDFDDSGWATIDVPSCVEMRGYGIPIYTNIRYPHKLAWPKILDRDAGTADYNPVSSYRRTFVVPEAWKDREVILRFDGVYSAYYVWVNGQRVGYAEDSYLPSEFDVSDFVREGENNISVQVYRFTSGSFSYLCLRSGLTSRAFAMVMPSSFGIAFAISSPSAYVASRALAMSLTAAFAFSVPKVMICETLSRPYLLVT